MPTKPVTIKIGNCGDTIPDDDIGYYVNEDVATTRCYINIYVEQDMQIFSKQSLGC